MDQTCPVVHKSRRPHARLKTVTLFYIHCGDSLICVKQGATFCEIVTCGKHCCLDALGEEKTKNEMGGGRTFLKSQ
jgi:hypothetical protein